MANEVDVYVDGSKRPQHLAIPNEQFQHLQVQGKQSDAFRPVCGTPVQGLDVVKQSPQDTHLACPQCEEQLDMWKDIHA